MILIIKKRKRQVIAVLFFLFFLFLSSLIIYDTSNWLEEPVSERKFEMQDSKIKGYTNGKLAWEVQSDYIWTGRNKYLFKMDTLNFGRLYDSNGKLVMDDLKAKGLRVNSKRKILISTGNIQAVILKKSEDDAPHSSDPEDRYFLKAKQMKYFDYNKKAYMTGAVQILQDDLRIESDEMIFFNDKNEIVSEKPIRIQTDEYFATSNQLVIFVDDDHAKLSKKVALFRPGEVIKNSNLDEREIELRSLDTQVLSDELNYFKQKDTTIVSLNGNIRILQSGKRLSADQGVYDKSKKEFKASGKIAVTLDKLSFLFKPEKRKAIKNKKLREALTERLFVRSDDIVIDLKKKRVSLSGNVFIKQKKYEILCDYLLFDDAKNEVLLTGGVIFKKGIINLLKVESFRFDIENENFMTDRQTEIEFDID